MKPVQDLRLEAEFVTLNVLANHRGSVPATELMYEVQNRLGGCDLERGFRQLMGELEAAGKVVGVHSHTSFWLRLRSTTRPDGFYITPVGRKLIAFDMD